MSCNDLESKMYDKTQEDVIVDSERQVGPKIPSLKVKN